VRVRWYRALCSRSTAPSEWICPNPLVEIARHRARTSQVANAEFVIADAQTHIFGAVTFDVIISQFGSCSSTIR
jgi:hypothetical protein